MLEKGRWGRGRHALQSTLASAIMRPNTLARRGGVPVTATEWDRHFTALYQENAAKMLRYASYQLRNQSVAEELVEDAFVRMLQRREELVDHPNLPGWLWKTLQHLILTEVKLAKYHREVPLEDTLQAAAPEPAVDNLADALPEGLSTGEREILLLYYQEELNHQEMARRLGISEMNSRTRLFRAKNHCKKLLEKPPPLCHKS